MWSARIYFICIMSDHTLFTHFAQRVEQFNEHLSSLTELNDIPRVSAAGNG